MAEAAGTDAKPPDSAPPKIPASDLVRAIQRHIESGAWNSIREIWRLLDEKSQLALVQQIAYYVGYWLEEEILEPRRKRKEMVITASEKQLTLLKKTYSARLEYEALEIPKLGKVAYMLQTSNPNQILLSAALAGEIDRLGHLLERARPLYSLKRFGNSRNQSGRNYRLIMAQEFIGAWSRRYLDREITLGEAPLADLIEVFYRSVGKSNRRVEPEAIGRAIERFTKNKKNAVFLQLLKARPLEFYL